MTAATAWRERAAGLFPGGVNSPVRAYRAVGGEPPILVRGSGAEVWDADGNRYLDYVGAFGPLLLATLTRLWWGRSGKPPKPVAPLAQPDWSRSDPAVSSRR